MGMKKVKVLKNVSEVSVPVDVHNQGVIHLPPRGILNNVTVKNMGQLGSRVRCLDSLAEVHGSSSVGRLNG